MFRWAAHCSGLWFQHGVALDCYAVGVFDGSQAGGYPGLAGGDGLAVAAAVGAFGQALARDPAKSFMRSEAA